MNQHIAVEVAAQRFDIGLHKRRRFVGQQQ
jgi:hypothetical protein